MKQLQKKLHNLWLRLTGYEALQKEILAAELRIDERFEGIRASLRLLDAQQRANFATLEARMATVEAQMQIVTDLAVNGLDVSYAAKVIDIDNEPSKN